MTKKNFVRGKVSLQEYLTYTGRDWGKPDRSGYARVNGHHSLYVNFEKDRFTWFKREKGGGIFNLMDELDGPMTVEEKKAKLKEIRENRTEDFVPKFVKAEKAVFDYDKLDTNPLSAKTSKYLTEVRGINPVLVNALSESGFLVEQKVKFKNHEIQNLLYPWRNAQGQIKGADQQGVVSKKTNDDKHGGYHKGIVLGSPASDYGFNFRVGAPEKAKPDKLIVVEAPIDAISYWQMNIKAFKENNDQVAFLSLSGVKDSVLNHYLRDHYYDGNDFSLPSEIHFATDNDTAGRDFSKNYGSMIENFSAFEDTKLFVDVPADLRYKDWNDQLRYSDTFETRSVPFSEIDTLPFYEPEKDVTKDLEITVPHEEPLVENVSVDKEQNKEVISLERQSGIEQKPNTVSVDQDLEDLEEPWEEIPTQEMTLSR